MRLQRRLTGQQIFIEERAALGAGGEARIFAVLEAPELVAKIYHRPDEAQARKLRAMLAAPPEDPAAASGSPSIAWPVDMLEDDARVVGFLMPRLTERAPIFDFYNPSTRRQKFPLLHTGYLHRAARNLAAAVRALHAKGYVIGDVNESNILVDADGPGRAGGLRFVSGAGRENGRNLPLSRRKTGIYAAGIAGQNVRRT